MTLDSTTSKVQYTQSGTTTAWPVPYKFLDNEDLIVITTVDDVDTTLVLDTDYTVAGAGDDDGGTVTISPAVATGTQVTIYREIDIDQPTELTTAGGWFPKVHEAVFDRLTMIDQQLQEQLDRSVKLAPSTTLDPDTVAEELFEARDDAQTAASEAEASAIRAEIASSTVAYYNHEGTLLTGEDTITLPWAYDTSVGVEVFLSGVKRTESSLIFTDAFTVTLDTPVGADTAFEVVASAGAKGDLAKPSGSGGVGFLQQGTGAVARTVQGKLWDVVSVKDFGAVGDASLDDVAINNAISYCASNGKKLIIPFNCTVKVPSVCPTLQIACDVIMDYGFTITLLIESGHALTEGLYVKNGNFSFFTISAEDTVVYLDESFVGVDDEEILEEADNLILGRNARMPILDCRIDMGEAHGNGYYGTNGSIGEVKSNLDNRRGVVNAGRNGLAARTSIMYAWNTIWNGAGLAGVRSQQGSIVAAQNVIADYCERLNSESALYCSRGSVAHVQNGSFRYSGGRGIQSRRSRVNAEEVDVSGSADIGVAARDGGDIVFTNGIANNCGNHGVYAVDTGRVLADGATVTNAAREGLFAGDMGVISFVGGTVTGSGARDIFISNGGQVCASGATTTSSAGTPSVADTIVSAFNDLTNRGIIFDAGSPNSGFKLTAILSNDWNSIVTSGVYQNSSTSAVGVPVAASRLTCLHLEAPNGYATQEAYRPAASTPIKWIRNRLGSTWTAWAQITP